jgi:hypothetical protein
MEGRRRDVDGGRGGEWDLNEEEEGAIESSMGSQ